MNRLFFCAAALSATLAHAADLYRVAGVVVNSQTNAPLAGANVAIMRNTTILARQVAADGRFSFDLVAGNYRLMAGTRDAMETYGLRAPDVSLGTAVITGPGQDTSHITFRWYPISAIYGKVVDENGEPVENALVQLVADRTIAGHRNANTFGWAHTDDRGEYRFGRIVGGTYYLAVTAEPWYEQRMRNMQPENRPVAAYAASYYPNASDAASAMSLKVKPGEEMEADFTLRTVPGASITVTYDSAPPTSGMLSLIQEGIAGTDGFQRQERALGFLTGVPPGRYLLRVTGTGPKGPVSSQQWVNVAGGNLEVKLSLHAAPTVSGTLEWKSPGARPPGTVLVSIYAEDRGNTGGTVSIRPDGSFTCPNLRAGRYRFEVHVGTTYFPLETRVEGAEVRDGVVNLAEDESITLHLAASGQTGALKGFVIRGGQPIDGMMVILAPVRDTTDWLLYRGFQTDSDGSFDFGPVAVGEYYLFAVDDVNVEYTNPVAIGAYYAAARRIRIAPDSQMSESIEPQGLKNSDR